MPIGPRRFSNMPNAESLILCQRGYSHRYLYVGEGETDEVDQEPRIKRCDGGTPHFRKLSVSIHLVYHIRIIFVSYSYHIRIFCILAPATSVVEVSNSLATLTLLSWTWTPKRLSAPQSSIISIVLYTVRVCIYFFSLLFLPYSHSPVPMHRCTCISSN